MDLHKLIVDEDHEIRLDSYIAEKIEYLSRTYINKLIKAGQILVNGNKKKAKYLVKIGDLIEIKVIKKPSFKLTPQDIFLDIIYEDNDIIVINKPKVMVVHPGPKNKNNTLVNALLYYTEDLSYINDKDNIRPGIVHRLDKDTSGLLVIAKNNMTHDNLVNQLKNRKVKRNYVALVHGIVENDQATINAPIGRNPKNRTTMAVINSNSKEAITHYKVMERFDKYTLLELSLETGRTHQIRVHMNFINHSIVGDDIYTKEDNEFGIKTQMLHAKKLGLIHPRRNEYMEFNSELPEEFKCVLKKLRDKNR